MTCSISKNSRSLISVELAALHVLLLSLELLLLKFFGLRVDQPVFNLQIQIAIEFPKKIK